jgi:endonuclease/exonuclease/phosphatase family metal-dependent hydrolase
VMISGPAGVSSVSSMNVLTWNVEIGLQGNDSTIQQQMAQIAALNPLPDVVVLQEVKDDPWNRGIYGARLTDSSHVPWTQAIFSRHCPVAGWNGSTCTNTSEYEGTAILTRLPLADPIEVEAKWIPAADFYHSARGQARAAIMLNGVKVQVYSLHLPTDAGGPPNRQQERLQFIAALKPWTESFGSPWLVGGDLNANRADPEIANKTTGMASRYADAWPMLRSDEGKTWPNPGPIKVDDYWFSDIGGRARPTATLIPNVTGSDHFAVQTTYKIFTGHFPRSGTPKQVPGMFEAEDFDDGGQDSAYHDSDLLNNPLGGSPLRPDQSVDIEVTGDPDSGGGYNVGWFNKDEWLRYTVSTTTAGTYIWYARVASPCTGGTITPRSQQRSGRTSNLDPEYGRMADLANGSADWCVIAFRNVGRSS